jgi:hypothetical protein
MIRVGTLRGRPILNPAITSKPSGTSRPYFDEI